ncbi:MAG: hypothetical protein HXY50_00340 [Ignavibacteriaceae bacterium]|nr:hypothetical protein [Ignavibacteriaceae bacterium]
MNSQLQKATILAALNQENSLFLYIAEKKIEDGLSADSAALLEKYLEKYPEDVCAKILLFKAYNRLGKNQLALQLLKTATDFIHSPQTFNFYLNQIELQTHNLASGFGEKVEDSLTQNDFYNSSESTTLLLDEKESYDKLIVSETLAKIYISQGELREAINVYEKLIEEKPENKQQYLLSIEELKSRLEK